MCLASTRYLCKMQNPSTIVSQMGLALAHEPCVCRVRIQCRIIPTLQPPSTRSRYDPGNRSNIAPYSISHTIPGQHAAQRTRSASQMAHTTHHTHARTHARTHACTQAGRHAPPHARTHVPKQPRTNACAHARTRASTHAHTDAHAHASMQSHTHSGVITMQKVQTNCTATHSTNNQQYPCCTE